ncbi:GntR family transcriptional regulator [Paracoccus sp. SCSIO 75233]|uniref:GntR family transcriptional regulator n=1 Tax=Paracoccus sp. SCSIO 75233 TaxID=3017782 RepID=UPI0022EFEC7A|nr:GntR family transcriptional regulator [Paracoccus sp. SCSIO 75233]WBU53444.1 GntR family transcriptional regulator [Paracoccus sp. SCSIO 75233]
MRPAGRNIQNTWQSVQGEVLRRIRTGEWRAGELIPTEHELAAELGCARATVNRALSQLAQDGIVHRRRRVGTRIASGNVEEAGAEAQPIRGEVEATGARYGYRLIDRKRVQASSRIASIMHLSAGEELIRYCALITSDDEAYCAELGYLLVKGADSIPEEALDEGEPLEWMRENVAQLTGKMEFSATRLTEECADILGGDKGFPVLTLDRTLWSAGVPLSHTRRVYPPSHRVAFVR